ncbi:MAG TPA: ABC transporter permease [Desulfomicrobiaceae bacterium]|jgi:polar amino acid transport system permease protein|nr:amino acid ABC transporter permease [Desulfomicrobiaceae bacterium]HCF05280.1 ABC transporter permease [Desulfomicrobiaceae bacterium]
MNYTFNWALIFAGEYGRWFVDGLAVTLELSGISILFALLLGTLLTVLRLSRVRPLVWFSAAYVEFFRNTPLMVQIFFWYFGSDPILPDFFKKWLYQQNIEFATAVIALSTYTAAFIAEELRSGILSIPKTQLEASRATGLTFIQAMRYVILPQAFRIIIPPLISQFLNLIKNSSLAMTIGVMELTYMARQVEAHTFHGFEAFTVSTLIYLSLSLLVSFIINQYNKHFLHIGSRR